MTSRKILVCGAFLEENHKAAITEAAGKHAYIAEFYQHEKDALAFAADAEIIYAAAGEGRCLAQAAKGLKWFCSMWAGVDAVLKPGVLPADALLSNSAGAYGVTVAEHMLMVTLMLLRRYPEYDEAMRRREWIPSLPIRSIKNSTLTILGTGDIGTRFAERAKAFGPAKIIGINRKGRKPSDAYDVIDTQEHLEQYLPETDILLMVLPGTKASAKMMTAARIAMLPKTSYIVNVGRGNSIDQQALIEALNNDVIAGAALDVMEQEPVPADASLWNAKHILLTPHCAGQLTLAYTRDKNVAMFIEDFENYVAGRPLAHAVNKTLGY